MSEPPNGHVSTNPISRECDRSSKKHRTSLIMTPAMRFGARRGECRPTRMKSPSVKADNRVQSERSCRSLPATLETGRPTRTGSWSAGELPARMSAPNSSRQLGQGCFAIPVRQRCLDDAHDAIDTVRYVIHPQDKNAYRPSGRGYLCP